MLNRRFAIVPILGMGCVVHAEPTSFTRDERFPAFAQDWVASFVAGQAGPGPQSDPFAPGTDGPAGDPLSAILSKMLAGPSHVASDGFGFPTLTTAGGQGNSPDDPVISTSDAPTPLLIDLARDEGPLGSVERPTTSVTPRGGGEQVVIPLPSGGALAAAGLVLVGLYRRR